MHNEAHGAQQELSNSIALQPGSKWPIDFSQSSSAYATSHFAILSRLMAMILSIIICETTSTPFYNDGRSAMRNSGVSKMCEVIGQATILAWVGLNASACAMSAGLPIP